MIETIKVTKIANWLKTKLKNRYCGIIFESHSGGSFDEIQKFIESYDHPFKTSVIYYRAFPEESVFQFMDTLGEELASKLGNPLLYKSSSLLDVIKDAELKMLVIDDCHFCDLDTLEKLLNLFYDYQLSIILVGERAKIATSQILNHPLICQWDYLNLDCIK